jgi:hypothetical protein
MTKMSPRTLILDDDTGDYPTFDTIDGVYRYDVSDAVWAIDGVYIDALSARDYGGAMAGVGLNAAMRYEAAEEHGKHYLRVLNIKTDVAGQNLNARLYFRGVNPGTTTGYYRVKAYMRPVDIGSDTIQHDMPDGADVQYLIPATIKLISSINDHEKMVEARAYIESYLKPLMWRELDGGYQGVAKIVTKRHV